MDNPEKQKLATYGTQDEEKQSKKHNTICVGYNYAQTKPNNVNSVNKTSALLLLRLCYFPLMIYSKKILSIVCSMKSMHWVVYFTAISEVMYRSPSNNIEGGHVYPMRLDVT